MKAGVAICGIRGSEVLITYFPSDELVYTVVLQGYMDVTSETTGETISLSDNQSLVVSDGNIIDTGPISQEQWDSELEIFTLRDEDFPDAEDDLFLDPGELTADQAAHERETPLFNDIPLELDPAESLPITGFLFILCFVMICGIVVLVFIGIIIYMLRKKNRQ